MADKWAPVVPFASEPAPLARAAESSSACGGMRSSASVTLTVEEGAQLKRLIAKHEELIVQAVTRSMREEDAARSKGRGGPKTASPWASEEGTEVKRPKVSLPSVEAVPVLMPGVPEPDETMRGLESMETQVSGGPQHSVESPPEVADFLEPASLAVNRCSQQTSTTEVDELPQEPAPVGTPRKSTVGAARGIASRISSVVQGGTNLKQMGLDNLVGKWTLDQTERHLHNMQEEAQVSREASNRNRDKHGYSVQAVAQRMLDAKPMQMGIMLTIFASAVSAGYQADWAIKNGSADVPWQVSLADRMFAFCFALELAIRLAAEGRSFLFWSNANVGWNTLDTFLVAFSLMEEISLHIESAAPKNVSVLRTLRIFRLVRVFRILRVARFFNHMRIMVSSMMNSMKLLIWAVVLLCSITFIVAVGVLELVSLEMLEMQGRTGMEADNTKVAQIRDKIGMEWLSLGRAVYTLLQSISGGLDWGPVVEPLFEVNPLIVWLCNFYIAMALFCVLNIVTGIFVENAKAMTEKDEEHMVMETIEQRKQWIDEVRGLWESFGVGDTAEVDLPTFLEHVGDVRIQSLFRRLGVEVESEYLPGLFALLDFNGTGFVDINEFALGIQMMQGHAKRIDMARMRYNIESLRTDVATLANFMKHAMRSLDVPEESELPPKGARMNSALFF